MSAAELMYRASAAGVEMTVSQNGRLKLRADFEPHAELLAELAAHKFEIIAALSAANDPISPTAWLSRVARLLGTNPVVLLKRAHLDEHDLVELAGTDAALVADMIRASPAWINRPQRIEQPAEVHVAEQLEQQHTVQTATTASRAWREADVRYINHLMSCRACHAPTGRYCALGDYLRQRYNDTPMEMNE
ncbi:hypothetical protein [Pseudomonas atacamensis]|uniref:TubC N-terminal docking domain-containing protein n=1 Tax=Pseudomonas iranensis TaxID=2745503 RepID=A0AAU7EX51_9PSED